MVNELIGVTGATGFVGGHLVKRLRDEGREVKTFRGDLVSGEGLDEFLGGIKIVVHLAGRFAPPNAEIFKVNVNGTFNLLEKCAEHGVKKVVFPSSIALYGEPPGRPWKETDDPQPNTVYGLSKLLAEETIRYWGDNHDIKYFLLRFPNIYGPGNQKGVVFHFKKAVGEAGKIVIYGDGKQERDFLFVSDAIEAIIKALNYRGSSDVFNIGSGKTVSLLELVGLLEKTLDQKIPVEFKPAETHVVRKLSGDIEKAKNILDWRPKVSLEEGLKK